MKKYCIISILSLALTLPLQAQADTTLTPPTPGQGDFACKLNHIVSKGLARAEAQCLRMAAKMADSTDVVPRSFTHSGRFQTVTKTAWTSGFFPGTLWYLYEATGNETLRRHADTFTRILAPIQHVTTNHDIGFMLNCSYGNAYRITGDTAYLKPLLNGARSLATRFNHNTSCLRSWGKNSDTKDFRVIIDNMMNLELLERVAKLDGYTHGDSIARCHALTTMRNHFRSDYSCYHLLYYNQTDGTVEAKKTYQGYADGSAWARGQAWALYGYTMMYRETADKRFLKQAEKVARYLLRRLKAYPDGIPVWDFDAPETQQERDASAAAVMASAFLELSQFTDNRRLATLCSDMAVRQLTTLTSDEYLAEPGANGDFVLKHSVGNRPKRKEVDVPLTYADYYYVEALVRLREMYGLTDNVYNSFLQIPDSCRTKVWWFHGENISTREGIIADLDAYRQAGVGGVVYYDQQHGPGAEGALPSMSTEWWNTLKFAAAEAKKRNLSFEVNISNGYVCGGPWITPELGMQAVYAGEMTAHGGKPFTAVMPFALHRHRHHIATLAFPLHEGCHETLAALPETVTADADTTIMLACFDSPVTARSLSYKSEGYSKGPQSIMNVPCEPQEEFCGNNFTLLPDLGELEYSHDGSQWHKACSLTPCYRMASLQKDITVSFPAVTGRFFRLRLHDWTPTSMEHRQLRIANIRLSARALIYRWQEQAAYASEYVDRYVTPEYHGPETVDKNEIVDITNLVDDTGRLSWTPPGNGKWALMNFYYAPTMAKTKHGRPNLMGLECSKLSAEAARLQWNNYAQTIIDTLDAIGCKPFGVCMDSHEAGEQNWSPDFPELFRQHNGYDIKTFLPATQGMIVGSVDETEQFLRDFRRTIADGISNIYLHTLQNMAEKAGVHFTSQAMGNGQSICSDNLMAKGIVERPQGEFWARHHDGAYDIKEAASAAHIYGKTIASAEAFTDFNYRQTLGSLKDETDMAAAFHVNELVVCASESQPWLDRYPGNTGYNRDYALNRNNTMWQFSRPFWDYQARNNFMQRIGTPVVDILVYTGDDTPMKLLAHRLPAIPEGYDFDVCSTDALHNWLTLENATLKSAGGVTYRMLVIEKTAVVRPSTATLIDTWSKAGLPVHDCRMSGCIALDSSLTAHSIYPDININSRRGVNDRVYFTHRTTDDADYYFLCNHSKQHTFSDTITLRTDRCHLEWWDALSGKRTKLNAQRQTAPDGTTVTATALTLKPDEAGFIAARSMSADNIPYKPVIVNADTISIDSPWTVTFDTLLGGPEKPVVWNTLTDWTENDNPDIRYFSGKATYSNSVNLKKQKPGRNTLLCLPQLLGGTARILVNGREAAMLWCAPWEADITHLLRKGINTIDIEVRNVLANRIIGDMALPAEKRKTWSYTQLYGKNDSLVPSGIVGKPLIVRF